MCTPPLPCYKHNPQERYTCYNWWTYTDISLSPKIHSLHSDSLSVHSTALDKNIMTIIYHCHIMQNSFTALKILCALFVCCSFGPLATSHLFTVYRVLPFSECPIVGITQYAPIEDWLLSFNNMHLRLLHVFSWIFSSFFSAK